MTRFLVAAALVLTTLGHVRAGYYPTHAFAGVAGEGGYKFLDILEGEGPLATGSHSYADSDVVTQAGATASASTGIISNHLLAVSTSAYSNNPFLFSENGAAQALAAWRDIASAAGLAPASLRFSFSITGSVSATDNGQYVGIGFHDNMGELAVLVNDFPNVAGLDYHFTDDYALEAISYQGSQQQSHSLPIGFNGSLARARTGYSWDTATFVGNSFTGTFHVDVAYNSTYGGYAVSLGLRSWSIGRSGDSESDASHTLGLQSVTLTDGTPVEVTFESGLQFGPSTMAAPAPPGVLLALSGILSLGGFGWLRRRRFIAAT